MAILSKQELNRLFIQIYRDYKKGDLKDENELQLAMSDVNAIFLGPILNNQLNPLDVANAVLHSKFKSPWYKLFKDLNESTHAGEIEYWNWIQGISPKLKSAIQQMKLKDKGYGAMNSPGFPRHLGAAFH